MADDRIEELKTLLPQCLLADWVQLGRRLARLLRDRHHPDQRDALLERLRQQVRASIALREERRLNVPHTTYPAELPITACKDARRTQCRGGSTDTSEPGERRLHPGRRID
jgi:hypothetical protein